MNLETSMTVSKAADVDAGDASGMTITMKGTKTVVHVDSDGWETEDLVEFTLTVKCRMKKTADALGISKFDYKKILALRDRDATLESFEAEIHPAIPDRDNPLSKYEGIVPDDTLNKIRGVVPAKLLEEIA